MIIAESSAKYIESANAIAYVSIAVVLVVLIVCTTIVKVKTGEWPWSDRD